MHLVDRRGRGLSSDGAEYSIEREYDDVAAVAESIGNCVTVFGHSYAGPIVLGASLRGGAIARAICYEGWPAVTGGPNCTTGTTRRETSQPSSKRYSTLAMMMVPLQ
jgi:pimeloyl-ACP methyl ester carboxylesterase